MAKLTVAKINELARNEALKLINESGLKDFLQVEGTKFAKDFTFETEEGTFTKPVRIDVVVPKLEEGENAETLQADFEFKLEEKRQKEQEKAEAKAKKIARDEKRRAEAKANKSNPVIRKTVTVVD